MKKGCILLSRSLQYSFHRCHDSQRNRIGLCKVEGCRVSVFVSTGRVLRYFYSLLFPYHGQQQCKRFSSICQIYATVLVGQGSSLKCCKQKGNSRSWISSQVPKLPVDPVTLFFQVSLEEIPILTSDQKKHTLLKLALKAANFFSFSRKRASRSE